MQDLEAILLEKQNRDSIKFDSDFSRRRDLVGKSDKANYSAIQMKTGLTDVKHVC